MHAVRVASVAIAPWLCAGIPSAPRLWHKDEAGRLSEEAIALCFNDIWMGTFALARGMMAMYESSIDCGDGRLMGGAAGGAGRRLLKAGINETLEDVREARATRPFECSATITEVMATLGESASYYSAAASDCIPGVIEMAYCSADITALFASLNQVANVASGIPLSCGVNITGGIVPEVDLDRRLADPALLQHGAGGHGPEERGEATGKVSNITALEQFKHLRALEEFVDETRRRIEERDRRIELSECVIDINQGLGALLRGGLAINAASKACKPSRLTTEEARRACAVDIAGSVGSLTFAAEFFSFASAHCPEGANPDAACTAEIFELATSMSSMAAVGAAIPYTCNPNIEEFDEGVPPDRRLAAKESSSVTVLV